MLLEADIPYDTMVQTMDTMKSFDTMIDGQPVRGELFPQIAVGDAPMPLVAQAMIAARLKRHRKPGHRGGLHGMSALIPMIDMLTILVVYLLVDAADYEILSNARNIAIPQSVSEQKPRPATVVTVTRDTLYVNGEAVAALADVGRSDAPVVEALRAALDRQAAPLLAGASEPRAVTVMAEKSLPYAVLRKVVASCAAANYSKVSLAVVEREQALLARAGA